LVADSQTDYTGVLVSSATQAIYTREFSLIINILDYSKKTQQITLTKRMTGNEVHLLLNFRLDTAVPTAQETHHKRTKPPKCPHPKAAQEHHLQEGV